MAQLELDAGTIMMPGDLEMPTAPDREEPDSPVPGDLVPDDPVLIGLVLVVHGSGSSRFSSRNRAVAALLRQWGLATQSFDLLSPAEERRARVNACLRFAIPLLAERTIAVVDDLGCRPPQTGAHRG